jgi:hypothetical protein
MTQFISWLFAQAVYVYQWFGSNFYYYLQIVSNTWDWIIDQSQKAYNAAIAWAWDKILHFGQDITNLFDWVEYQINLIKAGLMEDMTGLIDWIEYKLDNIKVIDFQWVYDLIDETIRYVQSIPDMLFSWVVARVNEIILWVSDNLAWIIDGYQALKDIVSGIQPFTIQAIRSFLENEYSALVDFARNPVAWIFDMLRPYFITFLCFVIAHALGSIKYEITYQEPWRE